MSTRWIIAGAVLLLLAVVAIALVVAMIRDVEADRVDSGGRRRGKRKSHRIDLFGDKRPNP